MDNVRKNTPPSPSEILAASEVLFRAQIIEVCNIHDDGKLQEAAKRTLGYFSAVADQSIQYPASYKSADLLTMLPEYRRNTYDFCVTREYLWKMLLIGFANEQNPERQKAYARALLDTPPIEVMSDRLKTIFTTEVLQGFVVCVDTMRLHQLLDIATEQDNEIVIRKAWQTIGAKASAEELLLASGAFLKFLKVADRHTSAD